MNMVEDIKRVVIEDELKDSYLDYSMSVIVGRALPDVRDGLKPVHRRILYSLHRMGVLHNKPFVKSARIVGSCLGWFHPHGDVAVYDALVRMAQNFSLRYPLIDGQGNWGSVDGDPAASMRYTEARLARIGEELLQDINKKTVDFVPNFDGSIEEPVVLPSRIPNLLVNGSSGIAVGMATNIPPHNLREVCDAAIALIENPNLNYLDLMKYIRGPDFPTGGIVCGMTGIRQAYKTGKGKIVVRGKCEIKENNIIITEIPYQVNKSSLLQEIAGLVREKRILCTGYNGPPQGLPHCSQTGCLREKLNIPSGERQEICRGLHAEQNAIIQAALHGIGIKNSILYCTHQPCVTCSKMIINAGITKIIFKGDYPDSLAIKMLNQAKVKLVKFGEEKCLKMP